MLAMGCDNSTSELVDGPIGHASAALTVSQVVGGTCSDSAVQGLSDQIIAQANCNDPNAFVEVPALANVAFGSGVTRYLEKPARDAFVAAANSNSGMTLGVNSMLRTVAAQYLLYDWYEHGQCGIQLAASPGTSNHESGLAFDTSQYNAWMGTLSANGFKWLGSSDVVHFDYVGAGAVDERGADVKAFQQLWNRNNPADMITEDGVYGPETGARLAQSPADGFPLGASCGTQPTTVAGYIDSASDHVVGWSADTSAGDTSIQVDLYFGGPAGSGYGVSTTATIPRPDVAAALNIGPNHGFDVPTPRYYCDTQAHPVHAYGHAVMGGAASELSSSPANLTCPPTPIGPGILRHVTSPPVLTAWNFDLRALEAWMTASDRHAHTVGSDWPDAVELGVTSDGAVWVVDGKTRRHVINPASLDAWGFGGLMIPAWSDDDAAKYTRGPDLPATPFLAQALGDAAVYVVDTDPSPPMTTTGTSTSSGIGSGVGGGMGVGGSGAGGGDTVGAGSNGCSAAPSSSSRDGGTWALGLAALAALTRGRRRRRS